MLTLTAGSGIVLLIQVNLGTTPPPPHVSGGPASCLNPGGERYLRPPRGGCQPRVSLGTRSRLISIFIHRADVGIRANYPWLTPPTGPTWGQVDTAAVRGPLRGRPATPPPHPFLCIRL